MTIEASGEIRLEPFVATPTRSIASEFGGSAPYNLENYYRGGDNVPNTDTNEDIPTSGVINMEDFYGSRGAFRPVMTVAIFQHPDIGAQEHYNYGWLSPNAFATAPGINAGFGSISNNLSPFLNRTLRGMIARSIAPVGNPRRLTQPSSFELFFNGTLNEISFGFYSVTVDFGGTVGEVTLRPTASDPGDADGFLFVHITDAATPGVAMTRLSWDLVDTANETVGWDTDDEIPFFFVERPPPT